VVVAIAAANRAGSALTADRNNGRGALLSRCCVQRVFNAQAAEAIEGTEKSHHRVNRVSREKLFSLFAPLALW
jgi:hypothetical protein